MPHNNRLSDFALIDAGIGALLACIAAIIVIVIISWGAGNFVETEDHLVTTTTIITQEGG